MMLRLPKPVTKARFLLIGYGLILLIWMSLEDSSTLSVAILGTGTAIIYSSAWIANRFGGQALSLKVWSIGFIFFGTIIGALSALLTATLMFFKSSWHGHSFPDYPPQMIADMFLRLPIWALSGTLLGLSCAIFMFLHHVNLDESITQIPSGSE